MANGWQRTTKGRPCEICHRGTGWCSFKDEPTGVLHCCMNAGGESVPGFELVAQKNNSHGYPASYYWPSGVPKGDKPAFDAEKEKARKLEEERRREKAAAWARETWSRAGRGRNPAPEDHPRARAYFQARGVPLEALPAGRVPESIRFDAALPRDEVEAEHEYVDGQGRKKKRTVWRDPKPCYPALVCAGVGYHTTQDGQRVREVRCVQRIYLDDGGEARKISHGEQKKCQGPTGGAAVRLSGPDVKHGVLVLCEGIETGVALLAALGAMRGDGSWPGVWACISTSGLLTAELGDDELKWVRRVIIAGDHDRMDAKMGHRPGEFAARACQNRLLKRHPNLPGGVDVALPGHRVVPEWVRADGWVVMGAEGPGTQSLQADPEAVMNAEAKEGKTVDWLDVIGAMGAEACGKAVMLEAERDRGLRLETGGPVGGGDRGGGGGDPPAPPAGGGDDDGAGNQGPRRRRQVDGTRYSVAQALLEDGFAGTGSGSGIGAGGCWPLRYYAGKWWRWVPPERGASRYIEANPAWLEAEATRCMDGFLVSSEGRAPKALKPKPADVNAALAAAVYYTAVPDGSMPTWIGEEFDERGRPTWESALAWGDDRPAGPIAAASVVAVKNGLLDVDAWVNGQVRLLPPSPRWFSRSCLPFALPVEDLEKAEAAAVAQGNEGPIEDLLKKLCPTWMRFLDMVSAGETEPDRILWKQTLQRWFGYILTPDISLERVLMIQGAPGTGKGTISEAMAGVVGEDNVLATTLDKIAGRFDLPAMVGRALVSIPELRVGGHTDIASALDTLNSISGGDPQSVEAKFGARQAYVRMSAKFVLTPNETPKLPDPANALVRRLVVLKMAPPAAKRDPELKRAIKGEKLGIMLWALYGLRDLRVQMALGNDPFDMPAESIGVIDDVRRSASPVMAFVEDECVVNPECSVGTKDLYGAYVRYAEEHGHGEPSDITFGRQLVAAVPQVRKDKGGGRVARYVGIGLKLQVTRVDEPQGNVFGTVLPAP